MNPWTGDLVEAYPVGGLGPLGAWDQIADPLHYGNFAGLWSRLAWFVFGCGLSALVFSGMMVWTKRTVGATTASTSGPAPQSIEYGSRLRAPVVRRPTLSAIPSPSAPKRSETDAHRPFAGRAGPRARRYGREEAP